MPGPSPFHEKSTRYAKVGVDFLLLEEVLHAVKERLCLGIMLVAAIL